jgi:HSP20 family molecular chaperone IbpA
MNTQNENDYVLVLELPDDVDTSKVKVEVQGRTIVIRAPRLKKRRRSIDHRYCNPEATPC